MAFKNRLLATAAIPLIALMGISSVSAAELIRPVAPAGAQSLVIKVQATDDELQQQQKKERRENRQNKRQNQNSDAGQDDQNNGNKRRNKQNNAEAQQQDNNAQEVQQPRRKKQNDDAVVQTQQQTDQEQVKPRRKKQADSADTQMQQDNSGQAQQDDQEQVKPRRKKQADNADTQMQQDNSGQTQQTDQEQVKPRRKKQADNADTQTQQDNSGQAQQNDQEQVKPRRKQQTDNAAESDQGQSADDKLNNAINKNNKKHNKQNQDQAEQPTDNSNGSVEKIETKKKQQQADDSGDNQAGDRKKAQRPVDVKKAKDIAADPSKTTDTVVLPVENGAAVLDSDKDADNRGGDRNRRKQQREEIKQVQAPKSDKDAQRGFKEDKEVRIRPVLQEKGERIPGFKGYDDFGGRRVGDKGNRFVINIDGRVIIRSDDDSRVARNTQIRYERLPNNLIREVVVRPNGDRIVTVRNRYGEIVRRSRIDRSDREVVIFYSPVLERGRDRLFLRDPGENLPPMRLTIPVNDYIIDVSGRGGNRNYEQFLEEPPVETVERIYSVDEVKNSARIRDKMRRIDLDTITFDTGSADIAEDQVQSLKKVGEAIKQILDNDSGETFLIEGHTDAVGSDESNLVLSDSRAESIANVLSDAFDIPAENLVTQGYGERYLKIDSDGPEQENRRVTIRRITPLVRPLASAE